jgi:ammonia channel protein AmtB
MDFLVKVILYVVFLVGALNFYFGGTKRAKNGHSTFILAISVVLLSYYYWFHIQL